MADSKSFVGGKPVAMISASCVSRQLSLMIVVKPVGPCNSSTGSASAPETGNEGPRPRTITRFGTGPEMMNALISTLSPVPTNARVERLEKFATLGVALGVGLGGVVAVGVGLGVGLGVGVAMPPN